MSSILVADITKNAHKKAQFKKKLIEKALTSSRLVLLSLSEFIKITNMKINKYMVDKFFHSIKDDIPIYLDNDLIKWCGYAGEIYTQKQHLLKLIKKNEINTIELNNNEYEQFRKNLYIQDESGTDFSKIYPEVDKAHGKGKTRHILVMPDSFYMILIRLPTSVGHIVAEHYINLSNIIKLYWKYQAAFYKNKFEDEVRQVCMLPHNIEYSRQQKIKELEMNLDKKYRIGCVYFIHEYDNLNYFKIGWCYNLKSRLSELQTANRRLLKVYKYYFTQFAYDEEQHLHQLFEANRTLGEWFNISYDRIGQIFF
jgi:hypothetical protein